jgi:hypothetical protein
MFNNVRIWLYGLRNREVDKRKKSKKISGRAAPKKQLVRIADDDIAQAKAIHIYYRTSPRANWVRVTDEIIDIPSIFRSKALKFEFINSTAQFFINELVDYGIIKAPPIEKPIIATPEELDDTLAKTRARVNLPVLPEEPRVSITKKEFEGRIALIIIEELEAIGSKWTNKRITTLINNLWKKYSKQPHLLVSDQFRINLVIHEIGEITKRERAKKAEIAQESFREILQNKDVTLDADATGGKVSIQYKEVFNKQGMVTGNEMQMEAYDKVSKLEYTKNRQSVFAQVVCDYDEMIEVNAEDVLSDQGLLNIAVQKVKDDVVKLFKQALDGGVFAFTKEAEYSARLSIPLINAKGEILSSYENRKGEIKSGWGYSTHRVTVSSMADLEDLIELLFGDIAKDIAKYIQVNSAAGIGFSGFLIERKIS